MAKDNQDILLDDTGDDKVENGDFAIGDGSMDDCFSILKLNQGALKYDPILGPNLIRMTNSKGSDSDISNVVRLNFERDNKMKVVKSLVVKSGVINLKF